MHDPSVGQPYLKGCLVVPGEYVGNMSFPFWMNEVTCSSGSPLTRIRIQRARVGISRLLRVYLKHLRLVAHIKLVRSQSTLLLGCRLFRGYAKIFEEGTTYEYSYSWNDIVWWSLIWLVGCNDTRSRVKLGVPLTVYPWYLYVFIVFSDGILGDYNP